MYSSRCIHSPSCSQQQDWVVLALTLEGCLELVVQPAAKVHDLSSHWPSTRRVTVTLFSSNTFQNKLVNKRTRVKLLLTPWQDNIQCCSGTVHCPGHHWEPTNRWTFDSHEVSVLSSSQSMTLFLRTKNNHWLPGQICWDSRINWFFCQCMCWMWHTFLLGRCTVCSPRRNWTLHILFAFDKCISSTHCSPSVIVSFFWFSLYWCRACLLVLSDTQLQLLCSNCYKFNCVISIHL